MPNPPCSFLSIADIGQGFTISKKRNSAKPSTILVKVTGTNAIVMKKPAISSQTIAGWSCTPTDSAAFPQIVIPTIDINIAKAKYHGVDRKLTANQYKGIAASVPKVPGALGAKPEPKPSAKKCTGLLSENCAVDDLVIAKMLKTLSVNLRRFIIQSSSYFICAV